MGIRQGGGDVRLAYQHAVRRHRTERQPGGHGVGLKDRQRVLSLTGGIVVITKEGDDDGGRSGTHQRHQSLIIDSGHPLVVAKPLHIDMIAVAKRRRRERLTQHGIDGRSTERQFRIDGVDDHRLRFRLGVGLRR